MHKSAVLIMLICSSSRHKYLQRRVKDRERKSASCVCVCLCLSSNGIQFKFNKVWICVLCLNSNSNVSKIEREGEREEERGWQLPHATCHKHKSVQMETRICNCSSPSICLALDSAKRERVGEAEEKGQLDRVCTLTQ